MALGSKGVQALFVCDLFSDAEMNRAIYGELERGRCSSGGA